MFIQGQALKKIVGPSQDSSEDKQSRHVPNIVLLLVTTGLCHFAQQQCCEEHMLTAR